MLLYCSCGEHQVLDAAFYDDNTLSFLLHEGAADSTDECVSVLCQMPLEVLHDDRFSPVTAGKALGQHENM